jgi:hypothetical protein
MRKFSKKLTSVVLLLAMIIGIGSAFAFAAKPEFAAPAKDEFFADEQILSAFGGLSESEKADYGGIYIDREIRNIVISFVAGSDGYNSAAARAEKFRGALKSADGALEQAFQIKAVTYTKKELKAAKDLLSVYLESNPEYTPGIQGFGVDYELNS